MIDASNFQGGFYPIYTLAAAFIALVIYLRIRRLYELSEHRGIQLFSQAFLFFAVGSFIRFIGATLDLFGYVLNARFYAVMMAIFLYMMSLSTFYLIYSLIWKKIESGHREKVAFKIMVLHAIAIAISIDQVVWNRGMLSMFFLVNLIVLAYGISVSYYKFRTRRRFLQVYYIALVLTFIGYFVNYVDNIRAVGQVTFYAQLITLGILVIFLDAIVKITRGSGHGKKKGKA
jgi:hypothetical protein